MIKPILDLRHIFAGYGDMMVLFDINISVYPHQTLILFGRNGAGKTTLLKTIAGYIQPKQGEILWNGKNITKLKPFERSRLGIRYINQEKKIFDSLTVRDAFNLAKYSYKITSDNIEEILSYFSKLRQLTNSKIKYLSGGERQMLNIALGMLGNPQLLLLDEPMEGLSPAVVNILISALKEIKENKKTTILIAEQSINIVQELADKVALIASGKIIDIISREKLTIEVLTKFI
jgi:ABC-type branched-subunit amino acid transport system ATPase component